MYEALAKIAAQLAGPDTGPAVAAPARPAQALVAGAPGLSVGVPPLPDGYQPRPGDLDTLKLRLRLSAEVGLVGRRATMGLHGQGGVGKSVLAAAVCHEDDVRSWFPDGVFWVTLGETPDLVTAQRDLARRLGEEEPSFSDPIEGLRVLRRLLADRGCLVVVDDVWSTAAAEAFSATSSAGRVLYTTRDASILAAIGATAQPVDVLDQAASLAFLERALGAVAADDRAAVEAAIAQTGGVILALSLVAATVRAGASWAEVTSRLEALARVYGEHPYADVFKPMRIAVDRLTPLDADRYYLLGVFPEDVAVPHATVSRLWGIDDPSPTLARLADARLLTSEAEGVRFHDLQRAFLIFTADEPWALLHRHLLDRHRPEHGWAYLADDEPYLWDHLLYHLQMAGEHHEMAAVVTNGRWLARRLHVAATLTSRLPSAEPQVSDLLGSVWLKPAWPLPDAPQALLRTLTGHTDTVNAVAFAPDGHTLATASDDIVQLWDPATGAQLTAVSLGAPVASCAWSPSDPSLAATFGTNVTVLTIERH